MDHDLAWTNDRGYIGMLKDQQTGLYRFGVRWYDPSIGRFTQPDPSTLEQHPYLYASANPCNQIDPTGKDAIGCISTMGAIAGGFVGLAGGPISVGFGLFAIADGIRQLAGGSCDGYTA